jgi:putative drug exporter of the RND superfamily
VTREPHEGHPIYHNRRRRGVTVRAARWSATHPWRAIALWLTFVAVCFAIGQAAGTRKATSLDQAVGESGQAQHWLHDAKMDDPAKESVLISSRSGPLNGTAATRAAADVRGRLAALPGVARVDAPKRSHDAILVDVTMRGDSDTAQDRVQPLQNATAATQRGFPQLRVEEVGDASIPKAVNKELGKSFGKATSISLPVTLLILLVAFGAIIAAGVPVLLALSAVAAAIGLSTVASHLVPDSGTTSSVILLMGMAVGVDYSLFYLKREREERARGRSHVDAIEMAAQTSGHSVVVSGLAVIVSMAGMFLTRDVIFSSLAVGSILVIGVAVLGSLTVLPAVLAKLGPRIDRPRVPVLWRLTNRTAEPRLWPALLRPALRKPAATLLVATVAMVALAVPALSMKLRQSGENDLPKSIPEVQTYDRLAAAFPGEQVTHEIVVQAPAAQAVRVSSALDGVTRQLASNRLFALAGSDWPQTRASADGTVHTLSVDVPYQESSPEARQSLRQLRDSVLPAAIDPIRGAKFAVTGGAAGNADYAQHQRDKLPAVIGFVLALTFLIMAFTFRSVIVAVMTILVNMLSAAAAFGVLVLTFQHHWADKLFGYHSNGAVVSWVPLFLFVVLFGLSMDYHVFVVSRIREAAQRGESTRDAVRHGITRSAGVVTSAAVVMVSVFAIFATLDMIEFKQLGVGLAAAILIDALVVRAVVLPSLMALLGRANWWPSRLSRRTPAYVPAAEPESAYV